MLTTPVLTPLTTPAEFTVAIAVLLLLHVPPVGVAASVIVVPRHIELLPDITAPAVTVTSLVALHPPEV
jgi:hypothetical protein